MPFDRCTSWPPLHASTKGYTYIMWRNGCFGGALALESWSLEKPALTRYSKSEQSKWPSSISKPYHLNCGLLCEGGAVRGDPPPPPPPAAASSSCRLHLSAGLRRQRTCALRTPAGSRSHRDVGCVRWMKRRWMEWRVLLTEKQRIKRSYITVNSKMENTITP